MTVQATRVRPGPASIQWLRDRAAAIQQGDPLAPVTVIVPNNYVGLGLRRAFAQQGYANVRFTSVARIAEGIGAGALAENGWSPLTPILEDALIRAAIRAATGFGAVAQHPSLIDTLQSLFRALREREATDAERAEWSGSGQMASAALGAFTHFERELEARHLYDDRTGLDVAATALATTSAGALREVGVVVVYLPGRLAPAAARFISALASRVPVEVGLGWCADEAADADSTANAGALGIDLEATPIVAAGPPPAERYVLIAPDASEETRAVVRSVLQDLRQGIPLHRVAILYRSREPYAALVRSHLDSAGLPWAGLEGTSLTESVVARGLLDLLRLPENDFARLDVLEWRSTLPHAGREDPSLTDWSTLSREAGVVHGVAQWRDRLGRLARELRESSGYDGRELSPAARRYREGRAARAELMANRVAAIAEAVTPPNDPSWTGYVTWAKDLLTRFVPAHPEPDERQAVELLATALDDLAAAAPFDAEIELPVFVHALQASLAARRRPQGRMGAGVAVGSLAAARGLAFDRAYVVGMVEGAFPSRPAPDPTFPDSDALGLRAQRADAERAELLAAFAAADGGSVHLSAPAWDADLRPVYAGAWLLEVVDALIGRPVTAAELRKGLAADRITRLVSPDDAIARSTEPLDLAERRVAELRGWRRRGALRRSALVRRVDLTLGRALDVQDARASNVFSEFDGNVGAVAASSQRLGRGIGAVPISSSAIERWCTCPFHYFLGRVIGVEATELPEDDQGWSIDPAARGSLMHDILESFFSELRAEGRPDLDDVYGAADHGHLERLALQAFADLEESGGTGYALAWENERAAILRDLHTLLREDEGERERGRVVPMHFEQDFGMGGPDSWPPVAVSLEDDVTVRLRGRIDRVDLGPDPARPTEALVIDYKTGWVDRKAAEEDPVEEGRKVQLAVYSLAARDHLDALGVTDPQIRAAYWQIVSKYGFRLTKFQFGAELEDRLRAVLSAVHAGIIGGAFPQVPGDETQRTDEFTWESCAYCEFDRICPPERRQLWERKQGTATTIHPRLQRRGAD